MAFNLCYTINTNFKGGDLLTLKEIAQALNVSPSTVSMVLNQKDGVSDVTRNKVMEMLYKNGYALNSQKKSNTNRGSIRFLKYVKHSLLVEGNEGFVSSIIDSAEREARKKGYSFVITSFREDMLDEIFAMVRENPLDGVILLGTELEPTHYHHLNGINVPLVVVDNHMKFQGVDSVVMNNEDLVYKAVEHLRDLGHKNIGYLHSNTETANFIERNTAYMNVLSEFGMTYNSSNVYSVGVTMQSAYDSMVKLLESGTKLPSALFADNDSIAIGSIKALKSKGYKIPKDISIIGFDDIPFCTMADPPLTTMRVPKEDIGVWTVRRLHYRINHPNAPVTKMQFGGNLVIRESTKEYSE